MWNIPFFSQLFFSSPLTLNAFELFNMNTLIMGVVNFIMLLILLLSYIMFVSKSFQVMVYKNHMLELMWTILPSGFLLTLGIPSLALLYLIESPSSISFLVKVISHQWYWSYENNEFFEVESYLNRDNSPFQLDVEDSLFIPSAQNIGFVVTSDDVLHSWSVPCWGIKMDACPGRLNSVYLSSIYSSKVYGQCSEICGLHHSNMPINITVLSWSYMFCSS